MKLVHGGGDLQGLRNFRNFRVFEVLTDFESQQLSNQDRYDKTEVGEFVKASKMVYRPILGRFGEGFGHLFAGGSGDLRVERSAGT